MLEKRDLGKAIQRLRGERTQRVCAEAAGISASSWSLYEGGERAPRPAMRERIAGGLGVELRVLEETAWEIRNERISAAEAGQKAAVPNAEAPGDPVQHAIEEHIDGVAHHLRELMGILRASSKPPLTP
jgi:transcriptional regulator with XRE-family HTH domain